MTDAIVLTLISVVLIWAFVVGVVIDDFPSDRGAGSSPSGPKSIESQRWTETQLFEPVSKWVEDAERAVVAADEAMAGAPARATCRRCQGGGIVADGLCRPCYMQSRRRLPGFSDGGYVVRSGTGQVVRYTGTVRDGTVRAEWSDGCEPKPLA